MKECFISSSLWVSRVNFIISLNATYPTKGIIKWASFIMETSFSRDSSRINSGPLLFLIYINDLHNELKYNEKLFADDTSLFTIVKDNSKSANMLNNDLRRISKWAYNWKMLFNPDPSKPAQEVEFSRKKKQQSHPTISLNNIQVERASYVKHLGILLDEKFNFKQHIDSVILKINKSISILKNLRYLLPLKSLLTIYKSFLRP